MGNRLKVMFLWDVVGLGRTILQGIRVGEEVAFR